MPLNNCKQCGKLYIARERIAYCTDCKAEQDALYRQVRDFLRKHPNSTAMDVQERTGIPVGKVLELQSESYIPYSY